MQCKNLGQSGLKVRQLSYGAWVSFGNQLGVKETKSILQCCHNQKGFSFQKSLLLLSASATNSTSKGKRVSKISGRVFNGLIKNMGKWGLGLVVGWAVVSCSIVGIPVSRSTKRLRKWARIVRILREFEEECSMPVGRLRQVVDAMAVEMHAGLASDGGNKLKMLLAFVDNIPNREKDNFLRKKKGLLDLISPADDFPVDPTLEEDSET